ncbi:50S ribosomal protein L6 [Candidatus Parcubacteria bacterium]|jgi:large subunit ribosomal protein L6|nr:50S ribosomal protein L6 [Candidatus Parcubacteria bacterium]
MSRIGKKPIKILEGVEVKIDGQKIVVKGPKGELSREIRPEIKLEQKQGEIIVLLQAETKKSNAFWGLTRSLVSNMVEGVVHGYEKKLEVQGLGYKANLQGEDLILQVGFSHSVEFSSVPGVKFSVEKNIITVSGIDKEKVGQTAAKIRKIRPPEPYKGKGIRYEGEIVRKKVGKKAATAE